MTAKDGSHREVIPQRAGDVLAGGLHACPLLRPSRRKCHVARGLLMTGLEIDMRYIAAWMLGVPFSVIAVWYILAHSACG